MARGDLSMERIVLGAALGIGAVAAAPFTGGGSVLGAATLASSLSGIGTGLAAVTAGIVGAAIADGLGDEADYDAYFEGYEEAGHLCRISICKRQCQRSMSRLRQAGKDKGRGVSTC